MATSLITIPRRAAPSYKAGYARSSAESANPGLWDGLVGAWVPALGITGLSTLPDISGLGNDGTLNGSMTGADWVSDVHGYALDFDGTDDYVNTTQRFIANGDGIWSVAAGVTPAGVDSANHYIFGEGSASGANLNGAGIRKLSSGLFVHCRTSGASAYKYKLSGFFTANQYTDIVVASSGGASLTDIYHDGLLEGGWTTNALYAIPTQTTNDITIGRVSTDTFSYEGEWDGHIHYLYAWHRKLTASEAALLHQDPLAPFRLRNRIIAYSTGAAPTVGLLAGSLSLMGCGR